MPKKPCPVEPLISSKYCQLSVCPECNIVNLSLPGRIALQFDTAQFLEIVHTFNESARILNTKAASTKNTKIIKLNHLH